MYIHSHIIIAIAIYIHYTKTHRSCMVSAGWYASNIHRVTWIVEVFKIIILSYKPVVHVILTTMNYGQFSVRDGHSYS